MVKIFKLIKIWVLLVVVIQMSNCWYYSFKGTLPPHLKNISIPVFQDKTAEFNIQQTVTDQIRLGFIKENILQLVEGNNSHSELTGVILSVTDKPLVYTTDSEVGESVTEYRITVSVEAEWYDKIEEKSVFKERFSGYSEYDPTGATDRTRDIALQEAIDNITEDIINRILADW